MSDRPVRLTSKQAIALAVGGLILIVVIGVMVGLDREVIGPVTFYLVFVGSMLVRLLLRNRARK